MIYIYIYKTVVLYFWSMTVMTVVMH